MLVSSCVWKRSNFVDTAYQDLLLVLEYLGTWIFLAEID